MQSVAATFRSLAIGVILSGMGDDGSTGMAAIHKAGGLTIGQDEATCAVYGMPRVCAELGILDCVVPLAQIPSKSCKLRVIACTHDRTRFMHSAFFLPVQHLSHSAQQRGC